MRIKSFLRNVFRKFGYEITPVLTETSVRQANPDITDQEWAIWELARPYTMTSLERVLASIRSADYVSQNGISGDIVECGVWRGGNSIAMARALLNRSDTSRSFYCYDTYEGMTDPGP